MAVLQMQRISMCALKKNRKAILERLQELGAMEIDIRLEDDSGYKTMDVSNSRATFEKQAQTATGRWIFCRNMRRKRRGCCHPWPVRL